VKFHFFIRSKFSVLVVAFLVPLFIFGSVDISSADEDAVMVEIANLKARIAALESKLIQQQKQATETERKVSKIESIPDILEGISIGAGATFILQGTHNANGDNLLSKGDDVVDASYSIDLEIEKEFEDYAKAFIHLEAGCGLGVEDELKVFSNVNRDADNDENLRLTEAWYEHYLTALPITITFGKIDATCFIDTNEYANDEGGQFLGRIFRNSPTIEFADNAAGIRLGFEPLDFLDLEFVLMDGDSDWEDMFEEMFIATQLNLKSNLFNRDGNYRLIGWFNDREHTKWLEQAKTTKSSFGFGLSLDQELTDNLGTFFRYGWQDPKVFLNGEDYSLEHSWSLGLQLSGSLWNREDDVLGLAYGLIYPSDEYKEAQNRAAKSEGHLELYYSYKVNDHFTLSPDLQVIWRPYGRDADNGTDAITVFGLRGQVDF